MSETAWEKVALARLMERPTAGYYINKIFPDFIELKGDRGYADDLAIVGGIATFEGRPVTVIAEEKGNGLTDRNRRNFGCPHPEGYRKALRLMRQAEKFHRPVICLVDTQGAYCGTGAEERGQGEAIATNLKEMMTLKTPVISIVIGEGGSGGALAIAVADKVAMLSNAIYSILSPEGFATILWKDSARAKEAAGVMKITADELLELQIIEEIIEEPGAGAHECPEETAQLVKEYIKHELLELCKQNTEELTSKRYQRFRAF